MNMESSPVIFPFDLNCVEHDDHWKLIVSTLSKLKAKCVLFKSCGHDAARRKYGNPKLWLRQAIYEYNLKVGEDCNFRVIENNQTDDLLCTLLCTLPIVIDNALSLPERVMKNCSLRILKRGEIGTVSLESDLVCSILAAAFLCTFPMQGDVDTNLPYNLTSLLNYVASFVLPPPSGLRLPYFNFWRLFHSDYPWQNESMAQIKREKLKCILEYFRRMGSSGDKLPNSIISYERRLNNVPVIWQDSKEELGAMKITLNEKIEDASAMLQVDFSNKLVGGGILSRGSTQEEILFCISPELIAARLFTEELEDEEVLVITGTRQFCTYKGYGLVPGASFKFQSIQGSIPTPIDEQGHELVQQIVAMDAIKFFPGQMYTQYSKQNIDRELRKSYTAFGSGFKSRSIATGNWGCGAFKGDSQLKFLIQWIAASQNKRELVYYAQGARQHRKFMEIQKTLVGRRVTVGQLYSRLLEFEKKAVRFSLLSGWTNTMSVFEFITKS